MIACRWKLSSRQGKQEPGACSRLSLPLAKFGLHLQAMTGRRNNGERCVLLEVEGVNSVLKYAATLSPNISFKLLASRITAKKMILRCKSKLEKEQLLDDCAFFHSAGQELLREQRARYREPDVSDYPAAPVLPHAGPVRATKHEACAAKMITAFKKASIGIQVPKPPPRARRPGMSNLLDTH